MQFFVIQVVGLIPNFGYFNNMQIILKKVKKLQKLQKWNICDGKWTKNEMLIENNKKKIIQKSKFLSII